jgi:hypothetical protein
MGSTSELQSDDAFSQAVFACTVEIDQVLSALRERYGTTAVVASLVAVTGCSNCIGHEVGQRAGESLRALIIRLERHGAASASVG